MGRPVNCNPINTGYTYDLHAGSSYNGNWWTCFKLMRTIYHIINGHSSIGKAKRELLAGLCIRGEIDVIVVGVDIGPDEEYIDQRLLI